VKTIIWGRGISAVSLAELKDGDSHIIEDNHCYVIVNRIPGTNLFEPSPWLFPEALEQLRKLPLPGSPPKLSKAVRKKLNDNADQTALKKVRR
jgi:hypothetical protein